MEIADSARKHGVQDADMRHAVKHPLRRIDQDIRRVLFIEPDRSMRLLEVVVLDLDTADPAIIHAMRLRAKFLRFL